MLSPVAPPLYWLLRPTKVPGWSASICNRVCHAGHGIDLTGELRHVEGIHHRVGSDAQADRPARREGELVNHRDPLIGIDEQPLPVLRHDLDVERRLLEFQRAVGIEPVSAAPQQDSDGDDDEAGISQVMASILTELAQVGA